MKHWVETYDYEPAFCEFDLFTENTIAYDIETTGLSKKNHQIYMIGCSYRSGNAVTIEQFFAENPTEEVVILSAFLSLASKYQRQMTFNGVRFDAPFLMSRCEMFCLDTTPLQTEHFDIYRECTRLKHLLHLSSCRQKDIESFLGIQRDDTCNGGELIPVYQQYCSTRDDEALALLKLHNFDDMKGMIALLPVLNYRRLPEVAISDLCAKLADYTDMNGKSKKEIVFHGKLTDTFPAPLHLHSEYGCIIIEQNNIKGSLLLYQGVLKHFLPDAKNYVYLKDEDIIVLKSLATSIPAERKEKATPDLCHIKKEGIFIKIPSRLSLTDDCHIFKENRLDKMGYLNLDEIMMEPPFLPTYLSHVMSDCM